MAALARPADIDLLGAGALELVQAGVALEGPDGIAFRHALLGEAVIAELSEPDRRALHASLAGALADPGEAGLHYALAGDRETARLKALEAADGARRPAERASHLRLAASCADCPDELELRLLAAEALLEVGLTVEALDVVSDLASSDPDSQARVHLQRGRALGGLGDLEALEPRSARRARARCRHTLRGRAPPASRARPGAAVEAGRLRGVSPRDRGP